MTTKTSPALKGNLGLVGVPLWAFKRHLPAIFTDHVIRSNKFITMNSGFGCGLLKVCRWLEMMDLESHMKWCDFTYLLGTWTVVIRATFSWLPIKVKWFHHYFTKCPAGPREMLGVVVFSGITFPFCDPEQNRKRGHSLQNMAASNRVIIESLTSHRCHRGAGNIVRLGQGQRRWDGDHPNCGESENI